MSRGLFISLIVGTLCWSVPAALAQQTERAEKVFQEGLVFHRQAESSKSADDAVPLLRKAMTYYRIATDTDADYYPAQSMWGICLSQLAEIETNQLPHARLVNEARQRIQIAAGCSAADGRAQIHWATYLLRRELPTITDPTDRITALREIRTNLESALKKSSDNTPTGVAHGLLGQCLTTLGGLVSNSSQSEALFRSSLEQYAAATGEDGFTDDPAVLRGWGTTLVRLARMDHDDSLYAKAADKLARALKFAPADPVVRYQYACALAMQGQAPAALQQIRWCIENDPSDEFLRQVQTDPDLASVRALPQFSPLLKTGRTLVVTTRAAEIVEEGAGFQRQAEALTNDVRQAATYFYQAIDRYRAATELKPDSVRAQFLWAVCLVRLMAAANQPQDVYRLAQLAHAKFADAAKCPDADAQVHEQRANFLLGAMGVLARDADARQKLMAEARDSLVAALSDARFTGQRAKLQALLGSVLVALTEGKPRSEHRKDFEQAVAHFEATRKAANLENRGKILNDWGIALLRLGQLDRDSMLVRQAIERFQSALELNPNLMESRYNLACAYAALSQPDAAFRHLRECLTQDTNGVYRANIQIDPDLAAIRNTEEYKNMFGAPSIRDLTRPRISER